MLTILVTLTLLFPLSLFAPAEISLPIQQREPINPFKPLINAIGAVECDYDTLAYNPEEMATGYFQIRPIRIEDYNRRTGSTYELTDMFNYQIAEKVFLYYASEIGPYDLEKISKSWNGSGPKTIEYWNKVKKLL